MFQAFLGGVPGFLGVVRVLGGVPGFLGVPGFSGMFRCSGVPLFRCSWKYYMPFRFSPFWMRVEKSLKRFWPYLIAFRSCISNGKPE